VLGRMRSPDGAWVVEVHSSRREQWYRVLYLGGVFENKASISTVQRILREHGDVDLADLVED
jgi:hypothetical protein